MNLKKKVLILFTFFVSLFAFAEENFFDFGQNVDRFKISPYFDDWQSLSEKLGSDFTKGYPRAWYDAGDAEYDNGNYEKAFELYYRTASVLTNWYFYTYKDDEILKCKSPYSNNTLTLDKSGQIEELYYSLYNMSCCQSLLGNYAEARRYLYFAILAGYPYLNYILTDSDMKGYFENNPERKKELTKWYNLGNSKSILANKEFYHFDLNDCIHLTFFSNGTFRAVNKDSYGWIEFTGSYSVKNFRVKINYDTEYFYMHLGFDDNHQPKFASQPRISACSFKKEFSLWCVEYGSSTGSTYGVFWDREK